MFEIEYPSKRLSIIAGPCVVESEQLVFDVAGTLAELCKEFDLAFVFKASYRKANRTSAGSFSGVGDDAALQILSKVKKHLGVAILTDIHESNEAAAVAEVADVLQIPAFLFRQTDLLTAAAHTGKTVNIKKGQFAAPDDMKKAVAKIRTHSSAQVWVCERGSSFGYHDLIVDMRSLVIMRESGCPVVFDATHSVQKPSAGATSGGAPQFIPALARAAVAVGVDAVFFETHPNPQLALSDASSQLALSNARSFLHELCIIDEASRRTGWT